MAAARRARTGSQKLIIVRLRVQRGIISPVVADRDKRVTRALSRLWERIRVEDSRAPEITVDLTPGRSSGCGNVGWDTKPVVELNLHHDGQNLAGREVLEYLLHTAAHGATGPATASEGRWHSEAYRDAAEKLGLDVECGGKGIGWNKTSLARGTLTRYRAEVGQLDRAMRTWEPITVRQGSRGPVKMTCSCNPPRILRTSGGTAAGPGIRCEACGQLFKLTE
jgi:hypothetical protein